MLVRSRFCIVYEAAKPWVDYANQDLTIFLPIIVDLLTCQWPPITSCPLNNVSSNSCCYGNGYQYVLIMFIVICYGDSIIMWWMAIAYYMTHLHPSLPTSTWYKYNCIMTTNKSMSHCTSFKCCSSKFTSSQELILLVLIAHSIHNGHCDGVLSSRFETSDQLWHHLTLIDDWIWSNHISITVLQDIVEIISSSDSWPLPLDI